MLLISGRHGAREPLTAGIGGSLRLRKGHGSYVDQDVCYKRMKLKLNPFNGVRSFNISLNSLKMCEAGSNIGTRQHEGLSREPAPMHALLEKL